MKADESNVELNLVNRGLSCLRFSKAEMQRSKTPDFRVNKNDEFVFFCEVKTSKKDTWLEEQLQKVRAGCIAGGLRNDPIFNRLTDDIYKAAKQFDAVNPDQKFPNVLAIVNHDKNCGFLDLLSVLTGNFYVDDGSVHHIYAQYSESRVKEKKDRVHLYIWIDEFGPERLFFSQTVEAHHLKLCELFGLQTNDIKQISS